MSLIGFHSDDESQLVKKPYLLFLIRQTLRFVLQEKMV